jgi:class 3 adenylate cyclase
MSPSPPWYRIASDGAVLRRAILTSIGVGTILTLANRHEEIFGAGLAPSSLLPIGITYLVPFVVSCASSVIALRGERRTTAVTTDLLEREIQAINRFPGQNPNPVLRVTEAGELTYANAASEPIVAALGLQVSQPVPDEWMSRFQAAAAATPPERMEVEHENQTFAILAVHVPELGVYNLYGTDITGAKVVARFPDRNPNPVLRMSPQGRLLYANAASGPITRALDVAVGDPLPADLLDQLQRQPAEGSSPTAEVAGGGLTFRINAVPIPEFGFVNLYGTDITAVRAFNKFPNENPNPVLRLTRAGRLTYANPASDLVRKALAAEVGDDLSTTVYDRIVRASEDADPTIEVEADGRVFRLRVVSVYEFDSINLYGTDITAARQVEKLNAENERLLLNILPASIAERLRGGETVIADDFDDMTVLFADVVGFTDLSARWPAAEIVRLLNEIFSMCDRLTEKHGLEKIKTVGDAYMVVGGLGHGTGGQADERPGHDVSRAANVADMALEMLAELERYRDRVTGGGLQMRVGINVGPAVAGVIGLKKFIYDVWGDTVNTASRMESTGVPGRIQVTPATYQRLRGAFEFESRGPIEVKGKGVIETWFLLGRRGVTSDAKRDPVETAAE